MPRPLGPSQGALGLSLLEGIEPPKGWWFLSSCQLLITDECRPRVAMASREVRSADFHVKSTHFQTLTYSFPRAATRATNRHVFLTVLEARHPRPTVGRVGSFEGCERASTPGLSPSCWCLLAPLASLACTCFTPISACILRGALLVCVSVSVSKCPPLYKGSVILD